MELFKVVSVEETKKIIDKNFKGSLGPVKIGLSQCIGRILYRDIVSDINVPGFERSTVDGYAVNSRDLFGASEAMPSMLNLKGEVLMGKKPPCSIDFPGDCLYVPTGGMLPEGADSVIMIEYTDKLDDTTVLANKPAAPGENVIHAGEDIRIGETVLKAGTMLRPYETGVLSSLGFSEIEVYRKPKVGVISTGDEIVGPEDIPGPGQVRDINTYLLYSSILEDGGEPVNFGVIKDHYQSLEHTVRRAIEECDIVLISGGSSVGKRDQTLKVINSLGDLLVHGIAIKPGKPTIVGSAGGKFIFGLPGHPLSCAVVYRVVVKYLMEKMINYSEKIYPTLCKFSINYHKAKGREEYLPVMLEWKDGEIIANPVFGKAGLITSFSRAWGYIIIDKNLEGLEAGQMVYAYKF